MENNLQNYKNNFIIKDKTLILKINKNIYSKKIITQTTYVLLDKYYFLIDEEEKYYIVQMKKKKETNNNNNNLSISEKDANIFLDELIESSSYLDQLERTSEIRQLILEKAILSQVVDDELLELENSNKNENNLENNNN